MTTNSLLVNIKKKKTFSTSSSPSILSLVYLAAKSQSATNVDREKLKRVQQARYIFTEKKKNKTKSFVLFF